MGNPIQGGKCFCGRFRRDFRLESLTSLSLSVSLSGISVFVWVHVHMCAEATLVSLFLSGSLSLSGIYVFVWAHMHVCAEATLVSLSLSVSLSLVYMCLCGYTCTCVQRPEVDIGCLP